MNDQQLTDHMAQYVNNFITRRFPNGLDGQMREIVADIVLEAFMDGCRFNEEVTEQEEASELILPVH